MTSVIDKVPSYLQIAVANSETSITVENIHPYVMFIIITSRSMGVYRLPGSGIPMLVYMLYGSNELSFTRDAYDKITCTCASRAENWVVLYSPQKR